MSLVMELEKNSEGQTTEENQLNVLERVINREEERRPGAYRNTLDNLRNYLRNKRAKPLGHKHDWLLNLSRGPWTTFRELFSFDNADTEEWYSPTEEEREVIKSIYKETDQERDNFLRRVINHSSEIQGIFGLVNHLTQNVPERTTPRKYTHQEADIKAIQELASFYGDEVVRYLYTDPNLKDQYLRKRQWYEEQEFLPTKEPSRERTYKEAQEMIAGVMPEPIRTTIQNFIRLGGKFYWAPIGRLPDDNMSFVLNQPQPLDEGLLKHIIISFKEGKPVTTLGQQEIMLGNQGWADEYRPGGELIPWDIHYLEDKLRWAVFEWLGDRKSINKDELESVVNLLISTSLLGHLISTFWSDADSSTWRGRHAYMKAKPSEPLYKTDFGKTVRSLARIVIELQETPYKAMFFGDRVWFDSYSSVSERRVQEFLKWEEILSTDKDHPLEVFEPPSGVMRQEEEEKKKEQGWSKKLEKLVNLEKVKEVFSKNRIEIGHDFEVPNLLTLGSLTDVLGDLVKKYISPDLVVVGHPWKHMRQLKDIRELSFYPRVPGLPFKAYIPPTEQESQLIIQTRKPVVADLDLDDQTSVKIFTPEYAQLTSLKVFSKSNQEFILSEDYKLEYEDKTGHYRIVFTEPGKKKLSISRGRIFYKAGIDPDRSVEGAPLLVEGLKIEQLPRVLSFADRLREDGFTRIAENLDRLVKSGKTFTTKDLEAVFKQGAIYAFKDYPQNWIQSFSRVGFDYLPNPNEEGYAAVQCAHAAMLYSEMLNWVFKTDGSFYPSSMLSTFNFGLGRVFVGAPHSDTRGTSDNARIKHDSTPAIRRETRLPKHNISLNPLRKLRELLKLKKVPKPAPVPALVMREYKENLGENFAEQSSINVPSEVERGSVLEKIVDEALARDVSITLKAIRQSFRSQIRELFPKINGRVSGFHVPEAVVKVGVVFREINNDFQSLITSPEVRTEYLKKLEMARSSWELAKNKPNDKSLSNIQRGYQIYFGPYTDHSSRIISLIDETTQLLKSL